jgi:hypothetical protein
MAITSGFDDRRRPAEPEDGLCGYGKPKGDAESVDNDQEMSVLDG